MSSPETLLEHATWLRALAAGLVRDAAAADDLVQDTWVAALRRPPSTDRPVRPWLARVIRNAARFRWRSERHRAAREDGVAADAESGTPTSEDLLARHQLQQLLARLVGELAEPFRTAILLRYAEGLEPTQIARRLGIPAGTIRWRIKEGLERLRRALDDEHAGDRKRWLLALAPIALWPRTSKAAPVAAGLAVAVVAGAVLLAAMTARPDQPVLVTSRTPMRARSLPRPTAILAGSQGWYVQPGVSSRHLTGHVVRGGVPVPHAEVRLVAGEPMETTTDDFGRFDLGEQAARAVVIGASAGDALGAIRHLDLRDPAVGDDVELELIPCSAWIAGRVTDAGGTPIAHARVLREDTIGTLTDGAGAYELCALPTAALVGQLEIVVRADGYGAVAAAVAPAGRITRDFVLAPEATITGTAVAGATVWIEPDVDVATRTTERAARQVATADGDGRFRIAGASGGRYRVGGGGPGVIARTALVTVEAGATADVALRMVSAATVHGRVTSRGAPVGGVRVAVHAEPQTVRGDDPSGELAAAGDAVTQPDGSFVLQGVPVGRTAFDAVPLRVTSAPVELVAGDNAVAIEGAPLGRIRGVVRRHGDPVPYARVDVGGLGARGGVTADGAGRYEVGGLEPGDYSFYADDGRRGAYVAGDKLVRLADGETRDFDLELAWGARIAGTVVDGAGAALAGLNVRFTAADGEQARCSTDAGGRFACASLRGDKTYTAAVYPDDSASRPFPFATAAAGIVVPDDDASVDGVRLAIDPRTFAIAGVVRDASGAPVADARVHATGRALTRGAWVSAPVAMTDEDGRFRIDALPPGDYSLLAETLHDARLARLDATAGSSDLTLTLSSPSCAAASPIVPSHTPPSPVVWDDRIELVGWDLPASAHAGETVDVALVFRVRAPLGHAWSVFSHFDAAERGHRVNADHEPVDASCDTTSWRAGDVLVDRFSVRLPLALSYTLRVGFFRPGDADAPWIDLRGPDASGFAVGTIAVEP